MVVLSSIVAGLVASLVLALLALRRLSGADHHRRRAPIAFAAGWAMLAVLSVRRTDQPQRWAMIPAAFMGLSGLGFLVFQPGTSTVGAIGWVWPIVLLALVVWMVVQSRRSLRNWSRRVVLYPVFAVLVAMAVGALYQNVGEARDQAALTMPGQLVDVGRPPAAHRLHRNREPHRGPGRRARGDLGVDGRLDRPRRRTHHESVRV